MKIVALADIHGELEKLEKVTSFIKEKNADVVVIAGDLTRFGPKKDAEEIIERLLATEARVLAVCGNGDTDEVKEVLMEKGVDIDKTAVKHDDHGFFGMGMPDSLVIGGLPITSYANLEDAVEKIKDCNKKIMVTHLPPQNTKADLIFTEQHVGSEFVKSFVEENAPDLLICGHIHEGRAVDTLGKTVIVNPGPLTDGYLAEIDTGEKPDDEIRVKLIKL